MRIAVLSGKGGTGKTFVSVNLACAVNDSVYIDCDVEEPNGHLFLKPAVTDVTAVDVMVPIADYSKCTRCRKCVDFCKYHALALIKDRLMVFPEVCHSCGGCTLFCPEAALTEGTRQIGTIEEGISASCKGVRVLSGCLDTGEESGVPIIKELMNRLPAEGMLVIDCPPGSACVVMESIRTADFCILVAEPTLFGVHNLSMVHDLVKLFGKPFGVVLNKCLAEDNPAERFCQENEIDVLARIPYNAQLAALNSRGSIAVCESREYRELFEQLLERVGKEAAS